MKKPWRDLAILVLAGWTLSAHAQTIWTYEVIGPNNKTTVSHLPPRDISYPAANQPAPIYNPQARQGIPLTAQQEAARLSEPMLIIILGGQI